MMPGVTVLRRLAPTTNLGRTRLAGLVLGCLMVAPQFGQTGNTMNSALWNRMGSVAIVLLLAILVLTYVRAKVSWAQALIVPALVLVAASSLADPLSGIPIAVGSTMALSLYGPVGVWIVRTLGVTATIPAAVALTPLSMGRVLVWHEATVLGILPATLLMSAMIRGIYVALLDQERSSARDAVVARTGTAILAATGLDQVDRLGYQAAVEIIALHPGVGWLVIRGRPDGLTVLNVTGLPRELRGRVVQDAVLTEPALLTELIPGYRHWRIDSYPDDVHVVICGVKRVPDVLFDAVRTLSNQVVLGERMIESHAALDHQANHDHLTQLTTRARFFQHLCAAVAEQPAGTVALLNIDLDDFKQVNDTYGHGAGDALLVEVATRMRELGVPGALPARFGGDEFAMLLTGLTRPDDAIVIAARLCDELIRPARVAGTTVTVGASIGVAVAEPGCSAADLTRCADIAMYSAKAQGKNRVERFAPDQQDAAVEAA
jgi:diguanylate cyclase (GGDEF)-like protein